MKPQVGLIKFINCFPFFYGLVEKKYLLDLDLKKGNPTDLNRMLKDNLLDLASISSIAYARNYRDYVIMPDLSISADGDVKSIYLFSKFPITELNRKTIALTNISATAAGLVQIIMSRCHKVTPRYFTADPQLESMLREADAALLIGDDAMRAQYNFHGDLYVYDIGRQWKEFTGLPMVFAVWAVRKEFAQEHLNQVKTIKSIFADAVKFSLDNIQAVAAKASQWEDFSPDYLADYFNTLKYDLNKKKLEGLKEYFSQAYAQGLLMEMPTLDILDI